MKVSKVKRSEASRVHIIRWHQVDNKYSAKSVTVDTLVQVGGMEIWKVVERLPGKAR
jgi:hypothetical protein